MCQYSSLERGGILSLLFRSKWELTSINRCQVPLDPGVSVSKIPPTATASYFTYVY